LNAFCKGITQERLDEDLFSVSLDTLVTPFSDDPAFQALLKQERMRVIGAEE
jgi:hypothetical protein